jgi:surfactin synthase thioesterase subunit
MVSLVRRERLVRVACPVKILKDRKEREVSVERLAPWACQASREIKETLVSLY